MSSDPTLVDPHSDAPMEYLGASAPQAPKRKARPWAPIVGAGVVFVAVLLAAAVLVGDWFERNVEMRNLVTQIEVSEKAMEDTQTAVSKAIDEFQAKGQPTSADQDALKATLQSAAAAGLAGVKQGGDLVASVKPLPWHSDIKAAQKAYLAHNQAWQDYLARAAKDGTEFGKQQESVNSTFEQAERPMRTAVPSPDLFGLRARVDGIYAPPPNADTGSGQSV